MNEIRFECPGCGQTIETAEDAQFQQVKCPTCQHEFFPDKTRLIESAPKMPSIKAAPPSLPPIPQSDFLQWFLSPNKKPLVIVSTIAGAIFGAFLTANENGRDFRAHPVATMVGSMLASIIIGGCWYFWIFFRERKKGSCIIGNDGKIYPTSANGPHFKIPDKFYDEVARELQEGSIVSGLWTKAYAEMEGDEAKTRALYIKYRVIYLAGASRQQFECDQLHGKQQREAMETTKRNARSTFHKLAHFLAHFLLFIACGFIAIFSGIFFIAALLDAFNTNINISLEEKIGRPIISFAVAFLSGWAAKHCYKEMK